MFFYFFLYKILSILTPVNTTSWKRMEEWRYSSTCFNLGSRWMWLFIFMFRPVPSRREPSLHQIEGLVGLKTKMDSTEKSTEIFRGVERPFTGHPSPSLLTTLSTHTCLCYSTLSNLINFRRLSIGLLQVFKFGHDHFFSFILFRIQHSHGDLAMWSL